MNCDAGTAVGGGPNVRRDERVVRLGGAVMAAPGTGTEGYARGGVASRGGGGRDWRRRPLGGGRRRGRASKVVQSRWSPRLRRGSRRGRWSRPRGVNSWSCATVARGVHPRLIAPSRRAMSDASGDENVCSRVCLGASRFVCQAPAGEEADSGSTSVRAWDLLGVEFTFCEANGVQDCAGARGGRAGVASEVHGVLHGEHRASKRE